MKTVSLTIDGKKITAHKGEKLLWVALDNGIYIPNLCALRDNSQLPAACRLCFVEVAGREQSVTACTEVVAEGMVVNTKREKVLRLARSAFELLMASHPVDCAHCAKNRSCDACVGTCTVEAITSNKKRIKVIDQEKCVKCGTCLDACPPQYDAIVKLSPPSEVPASEK